MFKRGDFITDNVIIGLVYNIWSPGQLEQFNTTPLNTKTIYALKVLQSALPLSELTSNTVIITDPNIAKQNLPKLPLQMFTEDQMINFNLVPNQQEFKDIWG